MFDKLRQVEERYRDLTGSLSDPVISQQALYARPPRRRRSSPRRWSKFEEYKSSSPGSNEARHMPPRTPTANA